MSTSEHTELQALIGATFEAMGGVGTKAEVIEAAHPRIGPHLAQHLITEGLMSVHEYRYVIRKYMQRAQDNTAQAAAMADHCVHVHGVLIDIHREDKAV